MVLQEFSALFFVGVSIRELLDLRHMGKDKKNMLGFLCFFMSFSLPRVCKDFL